MQLIARVKVRLETVLLAVQIAGCVLAEVITSFLALQQLIVGVRGAIWATHLCTYQRLLNEDDACHVVTAAISG